MRSWTSLGGTQSSSESPRGTHDGIVILPRVTSSGAARVVFFFVCGVIPALFCVSYRQRPTFRGAVTTVDVATHPAVVFADDDTEHEAASLHAKFLS